MPDLSACSADIAASDRARPANALIRRRHTSGSSGRSGGSIPTTCSSAKLRRMGWVTSMAWFLCSPRSGHADQKVVECLRVLRCHGALQEIGEVADLLLTHRSEAEVERRRLPRFAEPHRLLGGRPAATDCGGGAAETLSEAGVRIILGDGHHLGFAELEI